jgi:pimeloyl-ACP methyl ester carboxylesterase
MYTPKYVSRSEWLTVRGHAFHVRHWGREGAPKLWMLHGWMDASPTFQFVVDALERDWHVIAPDWRGFGLTAWNSGSYYFPDYLADLDALLSLHNPQAPARLVGHSLGGMVAMSYAGARPERVSRLVSIDAFGLLDIPPEHAPQRYRQWLQECAQPPGFAPVADLDHFASRLMRRNPHLTATRARFLAEHLTGISADGVRRHLADPRHKMVNPVLYRLEEAKACWRAIRCPVQWILGGGASDHPLTGKIRQTLHERAACFHELEQLTIADSGHMVQQEQPEQVAAAIERFMAPTRGEAP